MSVRLLQLLASIALMLAASAAAEAQGLPGPVTGLLAIGTFPPGTDMSSVRALLPEEVRDTVGLYLRGKIGQWFSLADRAGVVFILKGTDPVAARSMLEALPLGRAHMMRFDLLSLAPLAPLGALPGLSRSTPPSMATMPATTDSVCWTNHRWVQPPGNTSVLEIPPVLHRFWSSARTST